VNISDEAVTAAATAALGRNLNRRTLELILEAAAPFIAAAVWDEGMEAMYESTSHEWPPIPDANPYRSQE
jgi:hypothetical protein